MNTRSFAVWAVVGVAVPLVATIWLGGAWDFASIALAAVVAAAAGLAVRVRHRIAALPLEFAESALHGRLDGCPAYRFRIRLGLGRAMQNARARVHFLPEGNERRVELRPVLASAPLLLGPWTVVVCDTEGRCNRPGAFVVHVRAREGHRTWELERRWPREALCQGRFAPGLHAAGGKLVLDAEGWDAVVPEPIGEQP